ncbi:hypothetical protein LTR66_017381 [Elasticomyces elasticus]|nr:hypothetical protein LTR66_017381 [Elasticomyces elasticus]
MHRAGFTPVDLAIYNTSHFAILWDSNFDRHLEKERRCLYMSLILYSAGCLPGTVNSRRLWPNYNADDLANNKPNPRDAKEQRLQEMDDDEQERELEEYLTHATRVAFFKDGRRLKLYTGSDAIPYKIVSTTTASDGYQSTNCIGFGDFDFTVDTPFYGAHDTRADFDEPTDAWCHSMYLCLGTSVIEVPDKHDADVNTQVPILCILRSEDMHWSESCNHKINLDKMQHVSAQECTVVARLWGWEATETNMSGADTIASNPGGTRIAIATWNKILVYAVNPRILCKDIEDEDFARARLKKRRRKTERELHHEQYMDRSNYYDRVKDPILNDWRIATIKPVVLDLDGAVAHKMSWTPLADDIEPTVARASNKTEFVPGHDVFTWHKDSNVKITRYGNGNLALTGEGIQNDPDSDSGNESEWELLNEASRQAIRNGTMVFKSSSSSDEDCSEWTAEHKIAMLEKEALERKRKESQARTAKPPRKRIEEDELVVLTDRGLQIWNLGAGQKECVANARANECKVMRSGGRQPEDKDL